MRCLPFITPEEASSHGPWQIEDTGLLALKKCLVMAWALESFLTVAGAPVGDPPGIRSRS